jgi:hypothetical protein
MTQDTNTMAAPRVIFAVTSRRRLPFSANIY